MLGSKLPADDTLETREKPSTCPTHQTDFACCVNKVCRTHRRETSHISVFPEKRVWSLSPSLVACRVGQSSTDSPDPKCVPKTRDGDVSRTQPSPLCREFGTAPLSSSFVGMAREGWPWWTLSQPQKCLRICIAESIYPLPSQHAVSAYKYLFFTVPFFWGIGTPHGELLLFVGIGAWCSLGSL